MSQEKSATEYYINRCDYLNNSLYESCGSCYRYKLCHEAMKRRFNNEDIVLDEQAT